MSWLNIFSLVNGMQGNYGMAFLGLAMDYANKKEERNRRQEEIQLEEYNRKYRIADWETQRMLQWACGTESDSADDHLAPNDFLVKYWNKNHGRTLTLYNEHPIEYNFEQVCHLWIHLGKPL